MKYIRNNKLFEIGELVDPNDNYFSLDLIVVLEVKNSNLTNKEIEELKRFDLEELTTSEIIGKENFSSVKPYKVLGYFFKEGDGTFEENVNKIIDNNSK